MLQIETKAVSSSVAPLSVDYRMNERGQSATLAMGTRQKWQIIHARFQTEEYPRSILLGRAIFCLGSPDLDLYIGANKLVSKFDTEGVLHYSKVLPWETSPQYPKPLSFISKLNKTDAPISCQEAVCGSAPCNSHRSS